MPADSPGRVLIIGAGTGNDVSIALAKGATHVDAVEIDPKILDLGRRLHPDRPYDDPRVSTHVGDGRAFLEQTDSLFDLILFALPDSITLVTGSSAIRLESYLFTREAIDAARRRLTDGGGFAMYNYYRENWLVDRYAGTVAAAFGHEPCVDKVIEAAGRAVISAARHEANQRCVETAVPASRVEPATDDRPFPYFRGGFIPSLYLFALSGILLASLVAVRLVAGPFRPMRPYADLFFMGAAFLLLETKSITTFALLFGTTWIVNAIVFAGVLLAVLLAVETTRHIRTPELPRPVRRRRGRPRARLRGTECVLARSGDLASTGRSDRTCVRADLLREPRVRKALRIRRGCAERVRRQHPRGDARRAASSTSALVVGFRNLLIVAGIFYLAAFLLLPRQRLRAT